MKTPLLSHLLSALLTTLGSVILFAGFVVVSATWSEPLSPAPTCLPGNPGCSAPIITEVDPKVATLNDGKWCTSNGTVINCTSNAPVSSQWTGSGSTISYSGGNVGIGTANPGSKLEVVGTFRQSAGGAGIGSIAANGSTAALLVRPESASAGGLQISGYPKIGRASCRERVSY